MRAPRKRRVTRIRRGYRWIATARSGDVMRVAITGSTGLIGSALVAHFRSRGDSVTRVVRSYSGVAPQERVVVWNPEEGTIEREGLAGHDIIVHLAGEPIAGVWTPGRKSRIRRSRVLGTALIARTISELQAKPSLVLSGSAVGIYGTTGGAADESTAPGSGFLATVATEWEAETRPIQDAGIRVVHMRFANVLSARGGTLAALLPVFKLGLGARFGSGEQCWPWVALDEISTIVDHIISHVELAGAVNIAAPASNTNAEMTVALASAVRRPGLLAVPAFAARLAPGGMGDEILLGGRCVQPKKLLASGYRFRHTDLRETLERLVRS
jgi:uncharacterized protein (TIGR01777 family)